MNSKGSSKGFSLIELAMVLGILGLLLFYTLPLTGAMISQKKRDLTIQKAKVIETAIANFVAVNKRLPCPADGAGTSGVELRASATANFTDVCVNSVSPTAANTSQGTGVVPWVTLGLGFADVLDGWDRQITYRAAFGLTKDNALDMSACDPAGTAETTPTSTDVTALQLASSTVINTNICNSSLTCTGTGAGCTNPQKFLINKGFKVLDAADVEIMSPINFTGAAYVLISHGDNGTGAFTNGQVIIGSTTLKTDGALEVINYNGGNLITATDTTNTRRFRDMPFSDSEDTAKYFDDIVVKPTVFSLIQRAQVGPRSH